MFTAKNQSKVILCANHWFSYNFRVYMNRIYNKYTYKAMFDQGLILIFFSRAGWDGDKYIPHISKEQFTKI